MKEIKIKRIFTILIVVATLASCLKKGDPNIDIEDTTQTIMELQFIQTGGSTINSGMQYFSGGALTYPGTDDADTASYNISLAGPVKLGSDLNVTVGVDPTKVLDNFKSDSIKYELMPDSLYHFISTTAVIKAGERIANMKIIFYPSKVDPSKSYMLPVVVKDASGQAVSGNFGVIYFHLIGNPLAGSYSVTGTRYNYLGSITWNNVLPVPAGYVATTDMALSSPRIASPDDASTIEVPFGNVGAGYNYIITYDETAKSISIDYTFTDVYSNFVTTVVSFTPPSTGVKASFHLITHYNNALEGAGNDRIFDETFKQQ